VNAKEEENEQARIKQKMNLALGSKMSSIQNKKVEKEWHRLFPLLKEANHIATQMNRKIHFQTKIIRKMNLYKGTQTGLTSIQVVVTNNEFGYFYEW
jgi:hypothetical protein